MANPSTYFAGPFSILSPNSCVYDVTPPTFSGVSSLTPNTDGSITVAWALATDATPPIDYLIYIALGSVSAATLFQTSNLTRISPSGTTSTRVFLLGDQSTYLVNGSTYTVGVRARDAVGNINTNTVVATTVAIASGNLPSVYQSLATNIAATEVLLAQDHTNLNQDHVNFQGDHANFQGDHTSFQSDHTNFQSDHASFQGDHANLNQDHLDLASDLATFSGYLSTFNSYLSTFNSYNTTLGSNVSTFSSDLVTLAGNLSTLSTELSTFHSENTTLTTQIGILSGLVSALQVAVGSAAGLGGLELDVDTDNTLELEIIDEEEVT